ncbi:PTS transporter subunit EIIC [Lactobacillus sp. ESL0791]|uniref:PTS sugar transporter subunit IIC n=1 Tax=Lactobacillus sp. ESL0791 TaxID=2983234 RepID=UPI0023F70D09|nr:PTS transporter subunit EIIC [Lactobacillus sp. ESL0791]MDF7638315.1 PTS transporter subunit EIIC [Lactobacillus sp. ESL0791]
MMAKKSKFSDIINNKIIPFAMKIANFKFVGAIRDGFGSILPLILTGSIFLIVINFPVLLHFDGTMAHIFGPEWSVKLNYAVNGTFNLMGLVAAMSIAYFYAKSWKLDPVGPAIANLAAFVVTIPATKDLGIPLSETGSLGLFVAMIFAYISVRIFKFMSDHHVEIKMPETVPPAVAKSFSAMFPTIVVIIITWLVRLFVEAMNWGSINAIIQKVLGIPLMKVTGGYLGGLVYVLTVHLLWCVGIHGGNVANSIMSPIFLAQLDQNRKAFAAHMALPNIITDSFWVFVHIGGSGMLLALALLMLWKSKSAQNKEVAKLGIVPTIFSVNEPIMFGLPVIMNPIMLIPYVLSVVVAFTIAYFSMKFGIVPKTNGIVIHWTTPIFVSGYLATGSFRGVLLQLVNLLVSMGIYFPFFRKYDQTLYEQEQAKAMEKDMATTE